MALSTGGETVAAAGVIAVAVFASLHSSNPGNTGAGELSGGSPAYARKAITWNAAAPVTTLSATATFDVGAGSTVAYVGLWSAASGGTFYGFGTLSVPEVYASQGTFVLSAASALTVT